MSVAAAAPDTVRDFYDAHVADKIADFVDGNPRVTAAWTTIAQWAPAAPRHVLDIGCGFGQVGWWMAERWPAAHVRGLDLSPRAVDLASRVFRRENLSYSTDELATHPSGRFDLITLIDVYEHVPATKRLEFNSAVSRIMSCDGTAILTFPTPAHQRFIRDRHPDKLQPVDEDVDLRVIHDLAVATNARLVFYAERSIWMAGDYAHAVLSRREVEPPVTSRQPVQPTLLDRAVRKIRSRWHEDPGSRDSRLRLIEQALGRGAYRPRA